MSQAALSVESLRMSYDGGRLGSVLAVNDVSFDLRAGEILALLGPNGAGKTTTVKIISGLLIPSTGVVRIHGADPYVDRKTLRLTGSVLEGTRTLYWRNTCYENLIYFAVLKGMKLKAARQRAIELLARFGLEEKKDVQVRNLSRGMQQKLAIGASVIHRPALLLLDEPGLGLDAHAKVELVAIIREMAREGVAVLLTTHQLEMAEELSDRVAILRQGKVVKQESKSELFRRHASSMHEIQLLETLDAAVTESLDSLPFKVRCDGDRIEVDGGAEALYEVLERIRPARIHHISRYQSDLQGIYLKLTNPAWKAEHEAVDA
jgi:ABC-2 type transport system ATP-binding protein